MVKTPPPPNTNERKPGDVRIYVVSCLLFLCIVIGGAFLGMYITLPESEVSWWYPIAGVTLVGIPWLFWFLTFIYALITACLRRPAQVNNNNNNHYSGTNGTETPTSIPATPTKPGTSSGRVVQFGGATVMGDQKEISDDDSETSETPHTPHRNGQGGELHEENAAYSTAGNNEQRFKSHESEIPLTLSMSS